MSLQRCRSCGRWLGVTVDTKRFGLTVRLGQNSDYIPEFCARCGDREMALEGAAEAEYEAQMADENRWETEFEPALTGGA